MDCFNLHSIELERSLLGNPAKSVRDCDGNGQPIEIQLRVGWSDGDIDLDRIGIVRIGVCVDGFICDQRYVALSMPEDLPDHEIKTTINLRLRTPPNGNIAPPGVYMVFLRARTTGAVSHAQLLKLTC